MWGIAAVGMVGGYLVGAIPFGLLVGRLKGVDIRRHGSGNIGATNVGRVLGRGYGIAVFALDTLKGLLPVALAGYALSRSAGAAPGAAVHLLWVGVATACILGHMFPVYLGFKGGKGVATSLGALLGIYPYFTWPGLLAFALWLVVTGTSRYVSVGSVTAAAAFPIMFAVLDRSGWWGAAGGLWPLHVFAVTVAILVIYRHRSNLRRLAEGTESRIGSSGASRP